MQAPVEDDRKVILPESDYVKDLGLEVENVLMDHHGRIAFLEIVKEPKNVSHRRIWYESFTDAPYGLVKIT